MTFPKRGLRILPGFSCLLAAQLFLLPQPAAASSQDDWATASDDVFAGAAVGTASGLLITRDRTGQSETFVWGDGHSAGVSYAARF